jgi:hypothetical protein
MKRKRDSNQAAARAVAQTSAKHDKPLLADLEAAWEELSRGVFAPTLSFIPPEANIITPRILGQNLRGVICGVGKA